MGHTVAAAHAHAGGGLLQVAGHLLKAQTGVAHDGQQGIEGQAQHSRGGAGVHDHHDKAQQGQGGDGLNKVHHPEDDFSQFGGQVGQKAQRHPGGDGQGEGGEHQGQVIPNHGKTHLTTPPFPMVRRVTYR